MKCSQSNVACVTVCVLLTCQRDWERLISVFQIQPENMLIAPSFSRLNPGPRLIAAKVRLTAFGVSFAA